MMRLNLHTHSNKSDGVLSPSEVVKLMAEDKIEVMSLTDHDSIDGLDEAIEAGKKYGIKVIPGIELSTYSTGEIHILGYNFDYKNPVFLQDLQKIHELRQQRIRMTIDKLQEIGLPFDATRLDIANKNLGRVHIAKEMVGQGIVKNISEAFNLYIGAGKRAYISGNRLRPLEGVQLIKKYGGVAVLAHPVFIPKEKLELLVSGLASYGLDGLECYYSTFNETDTKRFLQLAKKYKLIATCGTDIHDVNMYISPSYDCTKVDERSLKKLNLL